MAEHELLLSYVRLLLLRVHPITQAWKEKQKNGNERPLHNMGILGANIQTIQK
jgi:hypothetical protein